MTQIPDRPISMILNDLENVPEFILPEGFTIEWYKAGYEEFWLDIHIKADKHNVFDAGVFDREFGTDEDLLHSRQCYLVNGKNEKIGTSTAWFDNDFMGKEYGRVHWVAIVPEFQGRGLSKPLLSMTCNRLKSLGHSRTYLTTSTIRVSAINLYLHFGFIPNIKNDFDIENWKLIQHYLKYQIHI